MSEQFLRSSDGSLIFPPDPRLLPFPYHVGLTLSVRRHVPPHPNIWYPYNKKDPDQKMNRRKDLRLTHTEWVLKYPPREAPPSQQVGVDTSSTSVHIVGEIALEEGRGAQLARCCLDGDDTVYVAKIYDPLYYPFGEVCFPNDISFMADFEYLCEAYAYEHLQKIEMGGKVTPKYYGSWTFDVSVPAGSPEEPATTRPVRMILIEWIRGMTMLEYINTGKIDAIPSTRRLQILAKALEKYSYLEFYGIFHWDFAARNVMVMDSKIDAEKDVGNDAGKFDVADSNSDQNANSDAASDSHANKDEDSTVDEKTTSVPDVRIIDLGQAYIWISPYFSRRVIREHPNLCNPLHFFKNDTFVEFGSWVPEAYDCNTLALNGWMKRTWANSEEFYTEEDDLQVASEDVPLED